MGSVVIARKVVLTINLKNIMNTFDIHLVLDTVGLCRFGFVFWCTCSQMTVEDSTGHSSFIPSSPGRVKLERAVTPGPVLARCFRTFRKYLGFQLTY